MRHLRGQFSTRVRVPENTRTGKVIIGNNIGIRVATRLLGYAEVHRMKAVNPDIGGVILVVLPDVNAALESYVPIIHPDLSPKSPMVGHHPRVSAGARVFVIHHRRQGEVRGTPS